MNATSNERPILFSGPMVNAILEGQKTQTRRVVKLLCGCPDLYCYKPEDTYPYYYRRKDAVWDSFKNIDALAAKYCPYGETGDILWVRETWGVNIAGQLIFRAECHPNLKLERGWKPSIHMPRVAARILLKITGIYVERLHELSEEDAISEGIYKISSGCFSGAPDKVKGAPRHMPSAVQGFQDLWDSINLKRGCGWETNPYVWVVNFERIL
jgi:hypothetical protein